MTPYSKAAHILEAVEAEALTSGVELPEKRYAQVGDPVVTCAEVIVACSSVNPDELTGPAKCNASQIGTFLVVISRECAWTGNDDGTTNLDKTAEVSEMIGDDSDLLWNVANNYSGYLLKRWNIAWNITGGVGITSMTFTTGID